MRGFFGVVVLVCRGVGGGDVGGVVLDAMFLWVMFRAGREREDT